MNQRTKVVGIKMLAMPPIGKYKGLLSGTTFTTAELPGLQIEVDYGIRGTAVVTLEVLENYEAVIKTETD